MTRHEAEQILIVFQYLQSASLNYRHALDALTRLMKATQLEHEREDEVNASLEKGVVNDSENKPIRKARH